MKTIRLILTLSLLPLLSNAQVGINTTTPTKDLDINGELRIRTTPNVVSSTSLTVDVDGNVGKSNNYVLYDLLTLDATNPVTYTMPSTTNQTKNDLDLGMSQSVTIPANKNAKVIVYYSVPLGTSNANTNTVDAYLGIRFLKNGTEAPEGSRKFSLLNRTGTTSFVMSYVTATYTETFAPSATPTNVTYALNGYMEYFGTSPVPTFKFNMWQAADPNYNWGRSTMSVQVFIKD
jgi:hypothetical protein